MNSPRTQNLICLLVLALIACAAIGEALYTSIR